MANNRRLMGARRVPGAFGLVAAVALVAGCDDGPDYVQYCASKAPLVRVDDRYCANGEGERANGPYGWWYEPIPDNDGGLIVVGNGGYPAGHGSFARPPAAPGKVTSAPVVAPGKTTTITRGGFGSAKAGSSGS
jgi:hypothetical protein